MLTCLIDAVQISNVAAGSVIGKGGSNISGRDSVPSRTMLCPDVLQ